MKIIKHNYFNKDDFGTYYITTDGAAMGRLYGFYDDKKSMVLDTLLVNESFRNKGIGTKLQEIREEDARSNGCEEVFLYVEKESWMVDWYKRRGYKHHSDYKEREGFVWMKKKL